MGYFLLTCCTGVNDKKSEIEKSLKESTNNITVVKNHKCNMFKLIQPVSVDSLKNKFREYTTSTLLSDEQVGLFNIQSNGFYGQYNLIDKRDNEFKQVGVLTIYNNTKPWVFDNNTDKFIEIICLEEGIYAFDNIGVGTEVKDLKIKLGNPDLKKGNYMVYHDAKNIVAIFRIINGKVDWFKVGYYKSEIVYHIENNIELLIQY